VTQIDPVCPGSQTLRRIDRRILFRHRAHGRMSYSRGTRLFPDHSKNRITWRNLVFSDEDFARQYF
jgi:hypothetical protein